MMKLEDLKNDWQQNMTISTQSNLPELIAMLRNKTSKIDKEIKRRDFIEITIALGLIPVWSWSLINSAGTVQSIGLLLAIASCIYIPYRLLKAKHVVSTKTTSTLDYLLSERDKVKQQQQLLETVVYWYIAPLTLSIVLITLGATIDATGNVTISAQMTIYYLMLTILVVGIYHLNKRAAKKKFGPLLNKIEQRLTELQA
jgi:hypothetical protein